MNQELKNLTTAELIEAALFNSEGTLTDTGALMVDTGTFTGRSPDDKFWVYDDFTADKIWWGEVNHPVRVQVFHQLFSKIKNHFQQTKYYSQEVFACADPRYRFKIKVNSTKAYAALFVRNMFIVPNDLQNSAFLPDYEIWFAPEFKADPLHDGVPHSNFAIIHMGEKKIIIGGTGYTGEIKKGVFSLLNFFLPLQKQVLSMHCSANIGQHQDTAVFFGLSGTGKTTLSTDPARKLIGDDEHGWSPQGVFNFEGGCYAKVVHLSASDEPDIYKAIRFGALLENTRYYPNTRTVDFNNQSVTPNTRVSYHIEYIQQIVQPSMGGIPKNIFFLTADANGVLPPIAKLNTAQAMFYFINGYTSKLAGTEMGIIEPKLVFSACFGAPFLPLHPRVYAQLLAQKMEKYQVNVWLINTGWTGGAYGTGKRIPIPYTRSMIHAAMEGKLEHVVYHKDPLFDIAIPGSCPDVPIEILDPIHTWEDSAAYELAAKKLANAFCNNFELYATDASDPIWKGAPGFHLKQ